MKKVNAGNLEFLYRSVAEPGRPGSKWAALYHEFWPAYRSWLEKKNFPARADMAAAKNALRRYMPEIIPTWERQCELAGAGEVAACFLSGFLPPPYIAGCSQAVSTAKAVQLARNYDFHPDLTEATLLLSAWNGRRVIANSDCLAGALDGMNEDGLALSLAFGGRKIVGNGFGIPFILRYVLEFCRDTQDAVEALRRVPSHMAYNVTVIDRSGAYKTVQLAPDRKPRVTDAAFATNHQGKVDWPENAAFNRTLERADHLKGVLSASHPDPETLRKTFLETPLYNRRYGEGFGTLYTAHYFPGEGRLSLHWPDRIMEQSFEDFREEALLITLRQAAGKFPTLLAGEPAQGQEEREFADSYTSDASETRDTKDTETPWWEPSSWGAVAQYWIEATRHFWKGGKT